jgi:hypothetical protein
MSIAFSTGFMGHRVNSMFTSLSTSCFLTPPHPYSDHQHMVYGQAEQVVDTFEKRLEHVLTECELDRPKFARMLSGAGQQKITNWIERGRIGSPSRREIFELTGASADWLNENIGVPFPHGPRKFNFVREVPPGYKANANTKMELTAREVALIENYRASDERFRKVVDEQAAASAEPPLKGEAS